MTMKSSSLPPWEHFKSHLQFSHEEIEDEVLAREGAYKGLSPEALYTSLQDLYAIQTHPLVQGNWVDLGAGVGTSLLLYSLLYPEREAKGVEFAPSRVRAGENRAKELGLKNFSLEEGDLLHHPLPLGDTYFLYFPTGPVLDRMLDVLSLRESLRIVAVESHGDLLPRLMKEPWLELEAKLPLTSARHHPEAFIFKKVPALSTKDQLFSVSYQERVLLMQEGETQWLGETKGMEWMEGERFNLMYPPRTIESSQVIALMELRDLRPEELFLVKLRRLGELKITTDSQTIYGLIRKILRGPVFSVELSTGERVEWHKLRSLFWKDHLCYESSSHFFSLPPAQ